MAYAGKYLLNAEKIIHLYDGTIPLHLFLKQFFAAEKKYGSKDRKAISHACFCFYRLGRSLPTLPVSEKIRAGIFLCSKEPGVWSSVYDDEWIASWSETLMHKIEFLQDRCSFDLRQVFPVHARISEAIDKNAFIIAHFIQPDLHIRIRPGKKEKILSVLHAASLEYESCGESCIALPNATRIGEVLALNKDAVVQDLSSQRIAAFLSSINQRSALKVWDCCAASGGKSILAVDTLQNIELTVSDVRPSIMHNLKKRFSEAGINRYDSFIADLSDKSVKIPATKYDMVICDAPCSGSGTWGRSPEQLYFFEESRINHYASLQQRILKKIIPAVKENGYLLYITCSIFRDENENNVKFILSNSSLQLLKMETMKGYGQKADTMFAALFTTSSL